MMASIVAGRRTPVAVRGGKFAESEIADLAGPVMAQSLRDAGIQPAGVDAVILGNALYGGGNPARVAALAAGLPESVAAMTVDTQCCSGLDAIALARSQILSGQAEVVIAGGVESYSRAPIRQRRPRSPLEPPQSYERPPFTPWPERDPDMLEAAAALALRLKVSRERQAEYAVLSHRRASDDLLSSEEIVAIGDVARDEFTRHLTPALCARLNVLAGESTCGVTAATTAVEADAAAVVVVVGDGVLRTLGLNGREVGILSADACGGDPECPALAPIAAANAALSRAGLRARDIDVAEIMEAFAVQAMACIEGIGLDFERVNRRGGALARGHPIGASGAILAVRLFHDLRRGNTDRYGLAAIAAAGGLGSALVLAAGDEA